MLKDLTVFYSMNNKVDDFFDDGKDAAGIFPGEGKGYSTEIYPDGYDGDSTITVSGEGDIFADEFSELWLHIFNYNKLLIKPHFKP